MPMRDNLLSWLDRIFLINDLFESLFFRLRGSVMNSYVFTSTKESYRDFLTYY